MNVVSFWWRTVRFLDGHLRVCDAVCAQAPEQRPRQRSPAPKKLSESATPIETLHCRSERLRSTRRKIWVARGGWKCVQSALPLVCLCCGDLARRLAYRSTRRSIIFSNLATRPSAIVPCAFPLRRFEENRCVGFRSGWKGVRALCCGFVSRSFTNRAAPFKPRKWAT